MLEITAILECISRKEGVEGSKAKAISRLKDNK
jgi:hypothetical protein